MGFTKRRTGLRFRSRRGPHLGERWFPAALVALALAVFAIVFTCDGPVLGAGSARAASGAQSVRFAMCSGPVRENCVVDGDTFWFQGEKIRLSDIDAPEVNEPQCQREAELGARASARLLVLLNGGAFRLQAGDRDRDRYGRLLRTVSRGGESLGAVLVREGLAKQWRGSRGRWC